MHRLTGVAVAAALASLALAPGASAAGEVHPGVQTITDGGQCTSNFVFRDAGGTYLGQAAHCATTSSSTTTNGCEAESLPLGTPVEIMGATRPGTLAYSSWLAMQASGETNPDVCDFNDFALVRIDPADLSRVDPTMPAFGGPTSVAPAPTSLGAAVYTYGNSSLRLGVTVLSPKQGIVVESQGNGWSRNVYTVTPGIPGDSGSGVLDGTGHAVGVLATLTVLPTAGSNGIGDLSHELAYAQAHGFGGVQLVPGTRPFTPNVAAAILSQVGN